MVKAGAIESAQVRSTVFGMPSSPDALCTWSDLRSLATPSVLMVIC